MRGAGDLLLVAVVVAAAWTRTPVGGLCDRAMQAALGVVRAEAAPATWDGAPPGDDEPRSLLSYFTTSVPVREETVAAVLSAQPPPTDGPFPEPWRTAASPLGADVLAQLDTAYDGDPEAALERVSVGEADRDRAIARARAAGVDHPERYQAHRAYLSDKARRTGDRTVGDTLALAQVLTLQWPIHIEHRVTSPFGWRIHPIHKDRRKHDGVDLGVPIGTPVYSAQAGTVVAVGSNERGGNWIIVDHGQGVRTSYCHLSEWEVNKGDVVLAGQEIAKSGNTGRSTGPHLHFNVKVAGTLVDPLLLRPAKVLPPDPSALQLPRERPEPPA